MDWLRLSLGIGSKSALLLVSLAALTGCTRTQYRLEADSEVQHLVKEKSIDPRWSMYRPLTVEMDPRSRYYSPYDPDREPMPADDPAAAQYMHVVDGMKGWPHWWDDGVVYNVENPDWQSRIAEYAPITDQGEVILTVDNALTLAYVNSPRFQSQIETLYLSALDVSTERFRFDTQFFGGNVTRYDHLGRLRTFSGESNTLMTDTDFEMRRRFATAGELLVGFANSFVWEFTGTDTNFTTSLVNFSFIQPLLRNAGRSIALEQLTIVERALLGNLRAISQYRQGFYTQIAIGELGVAGPSRRGGFFGGTGLTGFTGTGAGGIGGVGGTNFGFGGGIGTGGAGGGTGFAGGGAGLVGGYIGLLQQMQQIRNTEESLAAQVRTLALLESYQDAGFIDLVQVDQFRQSIETERAQLLQARNGLQNAIEGYLTGTLGLPPNLPIRLDDELIQPFQLITPEMSQLQDNVLTTQLVLGALPLEPQAEAVQAVIDRVRSELEEAAVQSATVKEDLVQVDAIAERRKRQMETDEERQEFDESRELELTKYTEVIDRLAASNDQLNKIELGLSAANAADRRDQLVDWVASLLRIAQELSLIQARARLEVVTVDPIRLGSDQAFQIALDNRLDLMNARASLVDTWRLIQFNANRLQSGLDVVINGDMRTTGNNPLKFQGPTGRVTASLQFDAPFTRLLERNNYRQALIDYQRARRNFITSVDSLHLGLRGLLRDIEQLRINLEIQRRAVIIAIRRVDSTAEDLAQPPAPAAPGAAPQFSPTTATNSLTALSDLRNTQNNFMSVWLNYYAARMRLARELGIMQLDDKGIWIDTGLPDYNGNGSPSGEPLYEPNMLEELPPLSPEMYQAVLRSNARR